MRTRSLTNRMKAAAVAALMCLSVSATTIPVMTSTMDVYAISVDETLPATKGENVFEGYIADLASKGINNITLTLTADYTGNFSYGFGIGTADAPYWYEWDGKQWVDTSDGTEVEGIEVAVTEGKAFTIQIDTSTLDLSYNPSTDKYPGKYQFRNYYSGKGGTVTIVSAVANGKAIEDTTEAPTEEVTEATEELTDATNATDTTEVTEAVTDATDTTEAPTEATEEPTEATEEPTEAPTEAGLNEQLGLKDVFTGYWADYADSGIENIAITFTADYTGSVSFGMGIGVADDPYWYEWDSVTKKWVDTSDKTVTAEGTSAAVEEGKSYTVVFDTSKYELSYNAKDSKYPGKFEFRNYYVSETGGTITITNIEANSKATSDITTPTEETTEDEHTRSKHDGSVSVNPTTGDGWSYKDGVLTATLARQQEFEKGYTLTRGFDEEYYAKEGIKPVEGEDPMNAHKFSYQSFGLFGVGETVTIESLRATVQSKGTPLKNFMYGGGLNVENNSPADTESAKAKVGMAIDENSGYWYNDMGEDNITKYEEAGVEFGMEPSYGYFLSSEDQQLGEYFNVYWDVPEEVKQYEEMGSLSFQYWYGVEDTEEYTEVDTVDLMGGILTYTQSETIQDPGEVSAAVNKTIKEGELSGEISYADLGLESWNAVKAVVFTLDTPSDMDKLVYGVGTSVGDDFKMWSPEEENWDYVMLNTTKGEVQIVWFVPTGVTPNTEFGNIQFGYWYGDKDGKEVSSITLKSVDVYYSEGDAPIEPNYGDVDEDGSVDIMDVILLNKQLLGCATISKQGRANADVDADTKITTTDSLNILKCVVEMIDRADFPLQ